MSTIPRECKRLAEVDFPIGVVGANASREKSIRHGNPSTLHLWWARRPLASCRAMLLSLLLPDPADPICPLAFRQVARESLPRTLKAIGPSDVDLRNALLGFIGEFSNWERSKDQEYLKSARALVRAAYGAEAPLVVDPFSGGGSIPLEALRVGCEAFASDLNPVACLILKILLEDIPREGPTLAAKLQKAGTEIKTGALEDISNLYPPEADGSTVIAYLWARTVRCESPNCGAEIPLLRSMHLVKRSKRSKALRPKVIRSEGLAPTIELEIFEPKTEGDVLPGTVSRAKATCLACGATMSPDRVRAQLRLAHGGTDVQFNKKGRRVGGARLLAVVSVRDTKLGRMYRAACEMDYEPIRQSLLALKSLSEEKLPHGLSAVPNEPTPLGGGSGAGRAFSTHLYGMDTWGDIFTVRQKVALLTVATALRSRIDEGASTEAVRRLLACSLSRLADKNASLAVWNQIGEKVEHVFSRQALPIIWDFAEVAVLSDSTGNYESGVTLVREVVEEWAGIPPRAGTVEQADACNHPLPDGSAQIWFTDPPYYDAVPYSELADFFFVWLKRCLPESALLRDPFDSKNTLTPKAQEIVQDETKSFEGHPKDKDFFERRMATAFKEGRRVLADDGIASVVFAHKTTEGWEALLSGMIKGGWVVTGSWPMATERPGRLRSHDSAALATSIHLVCRPRNASAAVGDWAEVARELPGKVRSWMDRLTKEGVRGADLVFACIGPAMEVYSRYSKVVDAQDREVPLGGNPAANDPVDQGYLAKVWEVVGRIALEQVLGGPRGSSTNLEEDARLTAIFLWALQSSPSNELGAVTEETGDQEEEDEVASNSPTGGYTLVYDVVRRFAQPLGIHLDDWEGRIVETDKGVVRLLTVSERAPQLFGQEEVEKFGTRWEESKLRGGRQMTLFSEKEGTPKVQKGSRMKKAGESSLDTGWKGGGPGRVTTLDRLHMAMLLQANGASAPLRALLQEEKKRGPEFERLARSLTALYPKESEERRLVEALALVIPK